MRRTALVVSVGLCACPPPAYDATSAAPWETGSSDSSLPGASESATASSTGEPDPTTTGSTGDPAASTSTSTTSLDPPDTTTSDEPNYPPEILSLKVTPDTLDHAGPIVLAIEATADVVAAEVVFGDGEPLVLAVGNMPTLVDAEVTSQKHCLASKFFVEVRDDRGLTDTAELALDCQLPQAGTALYTTPLPGLVGSSAADLALLPDGGVLVAGTTDSRMTLWALDAEGKVQFGWPKTLDHWSLEPEFDTLPSYATSVARDPDGRIFVAGVVKKPTGLHRYLAKLNDQGFLIWEDPGIVPGEEIAGITVTTDGVTVATGAIRTSPPNDPPAFDMAVWGYPPDFPQEPLWSDQLAAPATDPEPDANNTYIERGNDAATLPNGELLVVGERMYGDQAKTFPLRAFVQRYASDGTRLGAPWTSSGFKFKFDAARSVTRTPDGYTLVGWGEHVENSPARQVLLQHFDLAGNFLGVQHEASAPFAQGEGISRDREKKFVVAATTLENNLWGAWIFATVGADQPHAWAQVETDTATAAIECNDWGACFWAGTTELNGKSTAVVSKRAP